MSRLSIAIGIACLAVPCIVAPIACSSSQRRDQNYGTDVGADYQPEAGVSPETWDGGDLDSEAGSDATFSPETLLSADAPDALAEADAMAEADALSESDANLDP